MSGNRSTAVMQRRKSAPGSLNYFPTPPFATRALLEILEREVGPLSRLSAWEPACGEGHMVRPLAEACRSVRASDVHPYGDHELIDFPLLGATEPAVDLVITNPPFKLAQEFVETGLKVARVAVAMLVRSAFLEGGDRYAQLWSKGPPSHVLQFCERVVMLEGRLVRRGARDPMADDGGIASSATAYCWLLWIKGRSGPTELHWLPPSMSRLEREGDYPAYATPAPAADLPLLSTQEPA